MVSEDAESVAIECEDVSLPVLEPNSAVETSLTDEFNLYSSDVRKLRVLLVVLGVSDEDHLALRAVIEQDMLVGVLTAACVVVFILVFRLRTRVGLRILPLVFERRHVGVDIVWALELRLY